jgi:hypothetical protein
MSGTTHSVGDITIKDSGARREFATGAHRDRAVGKGAFNQLPFWALQAVAQVYEVGGIKYTKDNWKLGMPISEFLNSAFRHIVKACQGWTDEPHMAQACWNLMCAIETKKMIELGSLPKELDDVRDWSTPEGIQASFAQVRTENDARLQQRKESA